MLKKTTQKTTGIIFLLLFQFVVLSIAFAQSNDDELLIAISKERLTEGKRYSEWLANQNINFRYIDLSTVSKNDLSDSLLKCSALLLTGGADIYPGTYGKEGDTARCGRFDRKRDSIEFEAFSIARTLQMPILGICRGMQLINIASGGSLWIDLPEDLRTGSLHREGIEGWTMHEVNLKAGSLLHNLSSDSIQKVASNHHQGIEKLGAGLKAIAESEDGLIEAVTNADHYPTFFIAVQWHPEWMDYGDQLSGKLAKTFIEAAIKFQSER